MNLASRITGINEDLASTLDAMRRRVMQRAASMGKDPDAAWREAEPTYRNMLNEPEQRQAVQQKDVQDYGARRGHEMGEVRKFKELHAAADEAMRTAGEGPAREKLQQIMTLTQELIQMHQKPMGESGLKRQINLVESVLGI